MIEFPRFQLAVAVLSFLVSGCAATPESLTEKAMHKYGTRNDTVMVIFRSKGDVRAAMAQVKVTMKTMDPIYAYGGSTLFPYMYWVTQILGEAINTETKCGVIIGNWYRDGFPDRSSWEAKMNPVMKDIAQQRAYLYSINGKYATTQKGKADIEALKSTCFADTKIATNDFPASLDNWDGGDNSHRFPEPQVLTAESAIALAEKAMDEFEPRRNIVMVMFQAKGDVNDTMVKVKAAMRTVDPNAFMNPHWVTEFLGEAVNTDSKCGVVIGRWYDYNFSARNSWERIMDRTMSHVALTGTYLYSYKGRFTLTDDGMSDMTALQGTCFAGTTIAAINFRTFGSGADLYRLRFSAQTQPPTSMQQAQQYSTVRNFAVQQLVGDTLVGSACGNKLGLEVSIANVPIDKRTLNEPILLLSGSVTATPTSGSSATTSLIGGVSQSDGVLNLFVPNSPSHQGPKDLIISLFRDDAGKGWQGMIEGWMIKEGCDDVHLASKSGKDTSALPAMTGGNALKLSDPRMAPHATLYPLYWLKTAEARGSVEATYYLGDFYEQRDAKSPTEYSRALQYYRTAVEKYEDVSAQAALARMYEKGLGVPADAAKATTWNRLAQNTQQGVARICASAALRNAITRYANETRIWDRALAGFGDAMLGINLDVGDVSISKVTPDAVVSMNKPFFCRAKGGLDNPNVHIRAPDFQTEYNNVIEILASWLTGPLASNGLREVPLYYTVRLSPLGNGRYLIQHKSQSGIESEELDLSVTAFR